MAEVTEHDLLVADLRAILKTRPGRSVIYAILDRTNLYGDSFTGNSQTFYLEGKRSVGLDILALLQEADTKAYPRLLLEMQEVE